MGNNLKTIVYLTTNTINKKIYIGVHNTKTPDIFDGYIGNGININYPSSNLHPSCPFHYSVKKYGFDAFIRTTIKICDTREEALKIERLLVDDNFIARNDTYNITLGGGDPPRNDVIVYQYDINGNFIKEHSNILEASANVKGAGSISFAVKHKTLSGKYLWTTEYVEKLNISDYHIVIQEKPVYLYNKDGSFYKSFKSLMDVTRHLKVTLGPIQRAIVSKTKVKGYYISDEKISKFIPIKYPKHISEVHQYDLNGEYIKSYPSALQAQRELGKVYKQISSCIRLGKICGEYQWSWEKVKRMPQKEKIIVAKKIGQYTLTGELIKVFNTVRECRKEFGNVSRVLRGVVSQCKGYTFKYIE